MLKTVLVTGVTGFIGRYVAKYFFELGWSVVGIGTSAAENAPTSSLKKYERLVLPSPLLADLIKGNRPQVCIHCAGRASVPLSVKQPSEDFSANVSCTFNLLETLRLFAPECRLIYLSSAAVYGNPETLPVREEQRLAPISPYGFHKLIAEQLCQEFSFVYGIPTAIVRIFSAYGPGLRRQVVWDISYKVLTQSLVKLQGTGFESRDFIHVRDVIKAIHIITEKSPFTSNIYNIASAKETTIKELAELIILKFGEESFLEFNGSLTSENPINWRADIENIRNLGFTPQISLDDGISVYSQWCRAEVQGL
jgi:UDP-glucose 4-epimerase